jgi:SAM-dependent methyltransferase
MVRPGPCPVSPMTTNTPLHPSAATGFAQGAGDYVRGRPDYPPDIIGWLRDSLGLQAGMSAADLGAGTGKFLPALLATGADIIAIEPVASMLAQLSAQYPQVRILNAAAQAIPLADATLDAVVCATAFHWFATREALGEIHRVLKPGGRLGLVWNVRDERVDWVARLTALVDGYQGDAPRQASQTWRTVFPFPGFTPLRSAEFAYRHEGPAEQVIVSRVLSTSFIAALPPQQRARVADEVRALIAAEPTLAGRDTVALPYRTMAYVTQKEHGAPA